MTRNFARCFVVVVAVVVVAVAVAVVVLLAFVSLRIIKMQVHQRATPKGREKVLTLFIIYWRHFHLICNEMEEGCRKPTLGVYT